MRVVDQQVCIDPVGTPTGGNGIAFGANTLAVPTYTNLAAKDFRLLAGSACLGKGPASIQPATAAPASFTATWISGKTPATPGDVVTHVWRITNTGGTAGTASFFWAPLSGSSADPLVFVRSGLR